MVNPSKKRSKCNFSMQFQYGSMKTGYENRQAHQFKSVISKKDKIVFLIFKGTYDSQRGGGFIIGSWRIKDGMGL